MKNAKKRVFTVLLLSIFLTSFTFPLVRSQDTLTPPKIGIFYYVWYNEIAQPWKPGVTVDTPLLGLYDSSNPEVIAQHLIWIEDLGIDFVIISWWGNYDAYGMFTENVAKQVFEIAKSNESNLKFAIMVEPFPLDSDAYDYEEIYNHIHDTFVLPYSSLYYYNDSSQKPIICFYNDEPERIPNLTDNGIVPADDRFNTILVGLQPYTQWLYTDLAFIGISRPNQASVTPRYDESRIPDRPARLRIDIRLTQGVYDKEWETAIRLWQEGKIDTVLVTTWNEYFERTAIEPHFDATATDKNPYLLYQKTKNYISEFDEPFYLTPPTETPEPPTYQTPSFSSSPISTPVPTSYTTEVIPEFPDTIMLLVIVFAIVTLSLVAFKRKNLKPEK